MPSGRASRWASASSRSRRRAGLTCSPRSSRRSTASRSPRWARTGASASPWATPTTTSEDLAWVDESDYYYIKVENEPEDGGEIQRRTLVLDNLIHGYFILNHPERLDYDYEHIYALVAYRAAKAGGKVKFKPTPEAGPPGPVPAEGTERKPGEESPAPKPAAPPEAKASPEAKSPAPPKAEASPPAKPAAPPKAEVSPPAQARRAARAAKEDSAKSGAGIPEHFPVLPGRQGTGNGQEGDGRPGFQAVPARRSPALPMVRTRRPVPPTSRPRRSRTSRTSSTWRRPSTGMAPRNGPISRPSSRRTSRLFSSAAAPIASSGTCSTRTRAPGRRRRDRPGRHQREPDGHRPAARKED